MENRRIILLMAAVLLLAAGFLPLAAAAEDIYSYISSVTDKVVAAIESGRFPRGTFPAGRLGVVLDITILSDGTVYLVEVVKSSGIERFDQEAKSFVKEISPYPAIPADYKPRLKMRLPLEVAVERVIKKPETREEKPETVQSAAHDKTVLPKGDMSEKFREVKEKIRGVTQEIEGLYKTALDNSDPAKVAQEQLDLARLKITGARRDLFPKMEIQYSFAEGETITDPYESKAYALQLRQNLYDKGKTMKSLRKEQLNLEVAENEYAKTVQELKFEVIRSYLNVLGKKEELTRMQSFKEEVSKDYDLAQEIYEAGAIAKIEFIEIEAEYQRTTNMISQISNELALAKEKLRASMDLGPEEEIPLVQENLPDLDEVDIDVDDCVTLALANKPDVRLWEISLCAAEYARDIAASERAPRLDLVSSYGASGEAYAEQNLSLAEEWKLMGVVTWLFGGNSFEVSSGGESVSSKDITELSRKTSATTYSAKLSLLDKMQYYVQKKEAQIAYAQNLSNLSQNKQEVVFDTRKSFLEYRQSFEEYQVALFEHKFSRVNLELKQEAFKIGKAGLSEVAKTRADYMRKKLALVRAKTSYFISLAGLDKTTAYALGLFSPGSFTTTLAQKDTAAAGNQ